MYIQCNDVARGASLAPVIPDIFMIYLETSLINKLLEAGVCERH